jgi:hypothetical protein
MSTSKRKASTELETARDGAARPVPRTAPGEAQNPIEVTSSPGSSAASSPASFSYFSGIESDYDNDSASRIDTA